MKKTMHLFWISKSDLCFIDSFLFGSFSTRYYSFFTKINFHRYSTFWKYISYYCCFLRYHHYVYFTFVKRTVLLVFVYVLFIGFLRKTSLLFVNFKISEHLAEMRSATSKKNIYYLLRPWLKVSKNQSDVTVLSKVTRLVNVEAATGGF